MAAAAKLGGDFVHVHARVFRAEADAGEQRTNFLIFKTGINNDGKKASLSFYRSLTALF